jgi:hypothetical protein
MAIVARYFFYFGNMKKQSLSYEMRCKVINEIYDIHVKSGLSNREIYKRFIFPLYGICERSFYNALKHG